MQCLILGGARKSPSVRTDKRHKNPDATSGAFTAERLCSPCAEAEGPGCWWKEAEMLFAVEFGPVS